MGLIALLLRVSNLGTFSMWWDEIKILDRVSRSLSGVWQAYRDNAEHPPLVALVMWLARGIGLSDTWQRLVPISLGVATVLLLATWTTRHFGRRVGLPAGRAALAAILAGTAGVELCFVAVNRWTYGRYDVVAWFFLVVLLAVGLDLLVARRWLRPLGAVVAVAVLGFHLQAVGEYQRIGRPSWDRLAEVVRRTRREGEPLLTENGWCAQCLGYYLDGDETGVGTGPTPLNGDLGLLARLWPPRSSRLLVVGRHPSRPSLRDLAHHGCLLVEHCNTAALYRLSPQLRCQLVEVGLLVGGPAPPASTGWPEPLLKLLPEYLRGQPANCLTRLWRTLVPPRESPRVRLEMDPETSIGVLLGGWSHFERTCEGASFAWATGAEAGALLRCQDDPAPSRLGLRLWPYAVSGRNQPVRGILNGVPLGEIALKPGSQTVEVPVSARLLREGENLLVLQFAYSLAPQEVSRGGDSRPLAAGVGWIRLEPEASGEPG